MSVVVAIRDEKDGSIWMAADTQVTQGWTKSHLLASHSWKLFKDQLGVTIGCVGSLRDMNIISTSDETFINPMDILGDKVSFKSVVRDTVPKIFNELDRYGRLVKNTLDSTLSIESVFLVSVGEHCFVIERDGAVIDVEDMVAIGSGGEIAESAYSVLRDIDLPTREKAVRAVISSCEKDIFVDYPIIITNSSSPSFYIFDGENYYEFDEYGNPNIEVKEDENKKKKKKKKKKHKQNTKRNDNKNAE